MKRTFKILVKLFYFLFLTVLTQIGGIIYLLSILINKTLRKRFKFQKSVVFLSLYLISTLFIVPYVAPIFGREKVKHTSSINPTNYLTVLLNRNYVTPKLNVLLEKVSIKLEGTKVEIHYLDANFPFLNKFPLLPHLSHEDGKKIDLSLIYETNLGEITNKQKSVSGYGYFEGPKFNEYNQIEKCIERGNYQYDIAKYVRFGKINKDLFFSEKGTKILIESILKQDLLGKLLIEPHLKKRLKLNNKKLRYQGCHATRHDDHIHIQLK